jgi:hypothetical protein
VDRASVARRSETENFMRVLVATLALAAFGPVLAADPTPLAVLSSSAGRFVFGQISGMRQDQYLLDTETGRLWAVVCVAAADGQCQQTVLRPVAFVDRNTKILGLSPSN